MRGNAGSGKEFSEADLREDAGLHGSLIKLTGFNSVAQDRFQILDLNLNAKNDEEGNVRTRARSEDI